MNPIPVGSPATFDTGWTVKVLGVTADATAAVRAQNQFNQPPPSGSQFFMVNVSATFGGQGSSHALGDLTFSALGSDNTQIADGSCGVTPSEFDDFKEVFTGGTVSGNVCFTVPSATVSSLVMYVDSGIIRSQRAFFALR